MLDWEAPLEKKARSHKRKAVAPDGRKEAKMSEADQAHKKKPKNANMAPVLGGKAKADSQAPPRAHSSPQAHATSCKHEGRKELGW